ncbi:MAG: hypothetical protein OHK0039_21220 [Bacteroidia bacterium]
MNTCRLLLLLLLHALAAPAQLIEYRSLDNLNLPDGSLSMIRSGEGNFVSAGYWKQDGWMMKLNPCGSVIWSQRYRRGSLLPTRLYDVAGTATDGLLICGQIDTAQTQFGLGHLPLGWLAETDACGEVLREHALRIPASLPLGLDTLGLLCPSAAYALDTLPGGGVILTGQVLYWAITDTLTLSGLTRKSLFLYRLDADWQTAAFTFFPQLPASDTLVGYDVMALDDGGYVVTGAYYDQTRDSSYLLALKADANLDLVWIRRWLAAPSTISPPDTSGNLAYFHTGFSLAQGPGGRLFVGGSQFVDTTILGLPVKTLGASLSELSPATGALVRTRTYAELAYPISLGMRVAATADGLLLSGTSFPLGQSSYHSTVVETDWLLRPQARYVYADGSAYTFLSTSVLPLDPSDGETHALAGLRFLPALSDTSSSIVFFNSAATDTLPLAPRYYGGVIVQIEDVNVRDTTDCRPAQPPTSCLPTAVGLADRVQAPGWQVFPNPAAQTAWLGYAPGPSRPARLCDLRGRELRRWVLPAGSERLPLDLAGLPPGLYLLLLDGQAQRLRVQ